jgi:hypothetical protein
VGIDRKQLRNHSDMMIHDEPNTTATNNNNNMINDDDDYMIYGGNNHVHDDENRTNSRNSSTYINDDESDDSDQYMNDLFLQQLAVLQREPKHLTSTHDRVIRRRRKRWNLSSASNHVNDSNGDSTNGDNDDTTIVCDAPANFIQPEGNAAVLPKDVPDTTKSLSYVELLSFFDRTIHRISTIDIPYAKHQLLQYEREYEQLYRNDTHDSTDENNSRNENKERRSTVESLLSKWYVEFEVVNF